MTLCLLGALAGAAAASPAWRPALSPAPDALRVHQDTRLQIRFDEPPVVGRSGVITVRRASDQVVVDRIDLAGEPPEGETQTLIPRHNLAIDALGRDAGPESESPARHVWYRPVLVQGAVATIQLRDNRLAFDTAYIVTVDAEVFQGRLGGVPFAGITLGDGWRFTTRAAPESRTDVSVASQGDGADFRTLQGALNWVMRHCARGRAGGGCESAATPKTITVAAGHYEGLLFLRQVHNLTVRGAGRDRTVLAGLNFDSFNPGTGASSTAPGTRITTAGRAAGRRVLGGGRSVWLVEHADGLTLEGFSLVNRHRRSPAHDNQAEALYFNTGTGPSAARLVARDMAFHSEQDTLNLKGYSWFHRSLVAGNVDFIWGSPRVALFEDCEIRSVADGAGNEPGYILQSRAVAGEPGFVFLNSRLTAEPGVSGVYLARSGGTLQTTYADRITFVGTRMGPHIRPEGWCVGSGTSRTGTGTGACGRNPPPWPGPVEAGAPWVPGWQEFGSLDLAGAPLAVEDRVGLMPVLVEGQARRLPLASAQSTVTPEWRRERLFRGFVPEEGGPAGWLPQP